MRTMTTFTFEQPRSRYDTQAASLALLAAAMPYVEFEWMSGGQKIQPGNAFFQQVKRLQEYLGADKDSVSLGLVLNDKGKVVIDSIRAGFTAHDVGALNKLNALLNNTVHERKGLDGAVLDFTPEETAAILEKLPPSRYEQPGHAAGR